MEAYHISKATIDDIPQLLPLVNSAYRGESAKKGWTHEADLIEGDRRTDENSLTILLQNPAAVILKYEIQNEIRGCVYLEKQGAVLYLGMLSVSPEAQAQGIGKKLMHAAEAHAHAQGCTSIEMTVISVRKELISWYERNGYDLTGQTRPFHNDGRFGKPRRPIEFVVMEKKLGTGT
jgi:ribosomal protein S18 acetylase RimI-like enzyme